MDRMAEANLRRVLIIITLLYNNNINNNTALVFTGLLVAYICRVQYYL